MLRSILSGVLVRDLGGLRRELEAYPTEADIWRVAPGIANSAGNLALHLAGNLQGFIGAQYGGTGFVRNRDAEFSRRDVPRRELLAEIDRAVTAVQQGFARMTDADLAAPFPHKIGGVTLTTGDFMVHLAAHFTYHLGQIDYHRRLLTGQATPIRAVLPTELSTAKPA